MATISRFDDGPDGARQCVLPGAERVTDAAIAQRRADAPLKPKATQRPCDAGLFGDSHQQKEIKTMRNNVFELSRVRQIGKFWIVEILSPVSGWIVQGEHLSREAAEADRKNWM